MSLESAKNKPRIRVGLESGLVIDKLCLYKADDARRAGIDNLKKDGARAVDLLLIGISPKELEGIYSKEEIENALAARAVDFI